MAHHAMNKDERTMAMTATPCRRRRAKRRFNPSFRVGTVQGVASDDRFQHAGRLRSRDLLETACNPYGPSLLHRRLTIERWFAQLTARGGGLTCLPAWVRTHGRVKEWVRCKIISNQLYLDLRHAKRKCA